MCIRDRRTLQVVDRALSEQARLLELLHGRIEVAQRIESDQREHTAATLSLVAVLAGDCCKIREPDLRHRPCSRVFGTPLSDELSEMTRLLAVHYAFDPVSYTHLTLPTSD